MGSARGDFAAQRSIDAGRTPSAGDYLFHCQDQRGGFFGPQGAGVGRRNSAVAAQHSGVRGEARVMVVGEPFAAILRGSAAWVNVIATIWVLVIGTFSPVRSGTTDTLAAYAWNSVGIYFWAGAGALGLVIWGLLERQRERINLGVVGFALTVLIFYFSDVMDKLGRSASLIGMGVLLLVGGWILERARRQLIARMQRSAA